MLDASAVNITTVVTLPDLEGPLVKQISTLAIPADHVKEGIYTCNATNSAGSAKASATFTRAGVQLIVHYLQCALGISYTT